MSADLQFTPIEAAMQVLENERLDREPPLFDSQAVLAGYIRAACNTMQSSAACIDGCGTMKDAMGYLDWTLLLHVCAGHARLGKRILGLELYNRISAELVETLQREAAKHGGSRAAELYHSAAILIGER